MHAASEDHSKTGAGSSGKESAAPGSVPQVPAHLRHLFDVDPYSSDYTPGSLSIAMAEHGLLGAGASIPPGGRHHAGQSSSAAATSTWQDRGAATEGDMPRSLTADGLLGGKAGGGSTAGRLPTLPQSTQPRGTVADDMTPQPRGAPARSMHDPAGQQYHSAGRSTSPMVSRAASAGPTSHARGQYSSFGGKHPGGHPQSVIGAGGRAIGTSPGG